MTDQEILTRFRNIETELKRLSLDIEEPIMIHYHRDEFPNLLTVEKHGNFIDVRAAKEIKLSKEESLLIPLGISINMPDNYYATLLPRSSTFRKYGILVSNSIGIIDDDYRSMKDEWKLSVYATRDTIIPENERIAQFTLCKESKFTLIEGEWEAPERGGFGSTDKK